MNLNALSALVADDHTPSRDMMVQLLQSTGMRDVRSAVDGAEAVARIRQRAPTVLFLGFELRRDGLNALHQIRFGLEGSLRELPVIVVSAFTSRDDIVAVRDAGASEFVSKPLTLGKLMQKVRDVIERPRPFIVSANYVGPDRRRGADRNYCGPKRRASDDSADFFEIA